MNAKKPPKLIEDEALKNIRESMPSDVFRQVKYLYYELLGYVERKDYAAVKTFRKKLVEKNR